MIFDVTLALEGLKIVIGVSIAIIIVYHIVKRLCGF